MKKGGFSFIRLVKSNKMLALFKFLIFGKFFFIYFFLQISKLFNLTQIKIVYTNFLFDYSEKKIFFLI